MATAKAQEIQGRQEVEEMVSRTEFDSAVKRLDEIRDEAFRRRDEENNRQNHRIDILEAKVHDLNKIVSSIEKMAVHMENIDREQMKQGERLKETDERIRGLENKDGEMWRTILTHAATLIVGAVLAYFFSQIGL